MDIPGAKAKEMATESVQAPGVVEQMKLTAEKTEMGYVDSSTNTRAVKTPVTEVRRPAWRIWLRR